ncbi:MAG: tetratricopeptide repeat protein [Nanoarchaeota archaeon]|nr:tetratricopeptide repeat protein [Nanoarchaeota archaeon]
MEDGLLKKLKIGLATAGLTIFSLTNFNSAKAQENYIPKYNTTTHYIIKEIQKENTLITPEILDRAIDLSKEIITKQNYTEQEARNLMKKIDSTIFKQNPDLDDKSLSYNKSLIYLAIAEENNLPLYPVSSLDQIFVRWDAKRDGHKASNPNNPINQGDFNWDPIKLKFINDNEYTSLTSGLMDFEAIEKGIYLKNLDKKELLAVAYWQEALTLDKMQRYGEAIEYANKSLELNPNYPRAYQIRGNCLTNLGYLLQKKEFYESAIEDYSKAQELNFHPENQYAIGFNLYRLEKYDEAEEYYNKALNIFENKPRYLAARYLLYTKTNQKEKAERDLKKLEILKENSQQIKKN